MQFDIAKMKLFSDLVNKAIGHSRQVISMLESEFDALSGNNADVLKQISNEKKQYLVAISQVMAEQQSLLQSLGLTHDKTGVETLYGSLPENHPARNNWKKLQKLAREMAEKNLRNGVMLSHHTENTRKALDILTGSRSDAPAYQYGGRTSAYRQNRSLAYA
jgi:flagella synthesis protein FlgN